MILISIVFEKYIDFSNYSQFFLFILTICNSVPLTTFPIRKKNIPFLEIGELFLKTTQGKPSTFVNPFIDLLTQLVVFRKSSPISWFLTSACESCLVFQICLIFLLMFYMMPFRHLSSYVWLNFDFVILFVKNSFWFLVVIIVWFCELIL